MVAETADQRTDQGPPDLDVAEQSQRGSNPSLHLGRVFDTLIKASDFLHTTA
jgi:hypothetical protein